MLLVSCDGVTGFVIVDRSLPMRTFDLDLFSVFDFASRFVILAGDLFMQVRDGDMPVVWLE